MYRNIERLLKVVDKALFHIDGNLSYERTLEAIERLSEEVEKTDTDESVWELGNVSLDSILVGTYWFLDHYHNGQGSIEYRVMCTIGRIFSPGHSEYNPDSGEGYVYESLKSLERKKS
jgi:hypothetical protein